MRQHDDHLPFSHHGALGLDGFQQDISDVDDIPGKSLERAVQESPVAGDPDASIRSSGSNACQSLRWKGTPERACSALPSSRISWNSTRGRGWTIGRTPTRPR